MRLNAAAGLGERGTKARDAVAALVKLLKDEDEGVRGQVAAALGEIGVESETAVPALRECLKMRGRRARGCRPRSGSLRRQGASSVLGAAQLLKDPDDGVRVQAVEALWRIDHHASNVLTVLTLALKNEDKFVRGDAAHVLGLMGPESREAAPQLTPLLADKNEGVRVQAAESLWEIEARHESYRPGADGRAQEQGQTSTPRSRPRPG